MKLEWGIRASFVSYVEGAPDGQVVCRDGSCRSDGSFWFPLESIDEEGSQAIATGTVLFSAHDGMLLVEITRPRIVTESGVTSLMVSQGESGGEVKIAKLTHDLPSAPGTVVYSARLTTMGSQALGGVYAVGSELSPVTAHLT